MRKFSIDLKASAKGERKKAVKYLRGKGYEVPKRKNNIVKFESNNYLSNEHLGLDPCDEKDFYYYSGFSFNELLLTLPNDWDKLVEIVEEDLKEKTPVEEGLKEGDWVTVIDWGRLYADTWEAYSNTYKLSRDFDGNNFYVSWDYGGATNNGFSSFGKMGGKLRKATKEEIKEALIKEAGKRFKFESNFSRLRDINQLDLKELGCGFGSNFFNDITPVLGSGFSYCKKTDTLYNYGHGVFIVYEKGQWAEVIEEKTPKIRGYKLERHEDDLWGFGCTRFNKSLLKELCEARIDDSFLEETLDYIKKH